MQPTDTTHPRVAVVIVTYNRRDLLRSGLKALFNQDRMPDAIFLMDNNSSDGTYEMLREEGYLSDTRFVYSNLHANRGCSGGVYEGLKMAHSGGFDWYWMMDDDVAPVPHALTTLLSYTHISDAMLGRVGDVDGNAMSWIDYVDVPTGRVFSTDDSAFRVWKKSWICVNGTSFEGFFVSKRVLDSVGYPDPDIFIQGDDTVYGYLVSQVANNIYLSEVLFKKLIEKKHSHLVRFGIRFALETEFSLYYRLRNSFVVEAYFKRATIKSNRKISHFQVIALRFLKALLVSILSPKPLTRIQIIWRAFRNGRQMAKKIHSRENLYCY